MCSRSGSGRSASSAARSSTAARSTTTPGSTSGSGARRLRLPPELNSRLGPCPKALEVTAVQDEHAERRQAGEDEHRPRLAEQQRGDRQRDRGDDRRDRHIARERKDREPHDRPDKPDERREPEQRPPVGRDHLPALREAEEQRPPVAEHRRAAGQRSGDRPGREGRGERGHEAFRDVEHDHRNRVAGPEGPPDVRGADVPAADGANVDTLRPADDPVPEREAAGQVADDDEGQRLDGYLKGIPYPVTQLLTVTQSRFSKNASMYAARSVR